jgi:hypothetical protein
MLKQFQAPIFKIVLSSSCLSFLYVGVDIGFIEFPDFDLNLTDDRTSALPM